jgi:hypothetical protein
MIEARHGDVGRLTFFRLSIAQLRTAIATEVPR